MGADNKSCYTISLKLFRHLGTNLNRNLYALFDEAISNSWDSGATYVNIVVDSRDSKITIIDDGCGMTSKDFQDLFLAVGHPKQNAPIGKSSNNRPKLGTKGIGKLAFLLNSRKFSVISKKLDQECIGGTVDIAKLNVSIKKSVDDDNLYVLEKLNEKYINDDLMNHKNGTVLCFEELSDQRFFDVDKIRNHISLSFNFSKFKGDFSIQVNNQPVKNEIYEKLIEKTECIWVIGDFDISEYFSPGKNIEVMPIHSDEISGFLASVENFEDLELPSIGGRVSIDFYDNGRKREKTITSRLTSSSTIYNFLYGQIHCNDLHSINDPYSSCRGAVLCGIEEFESVLSTLEHLLLMEVSDKWERKRIENGKSCDPKVIERSILGIQENSSIFKNIVSEEYINLNNFEKINYWKENLKNDAVNNFNPYYFCFVVENILRILILESDTELDATSKKQKNVNEINERKMKHKCKIRYEIRENKTDTHYLSTHAIINEILNNKLIKISNENDDMEKIFITFEIFRNVVCHMGTLTEVGRNEMKKLQVEIFNMIDNLTLDMENTN